MNHIFISYSRRDQEKVTAFAEELRSLGIEIWLDIMGERSGIPYSVKWFEAIEEAIFTASGAIIFNTEAWECSEPCQKEYERIKDIRLPFLYVDMEKLQVKRQEVVRKTAEWCRVQIAAEENGYCRWMLSGAYRLYRGIPMDSHYLKGGSFIYNWFWLRKCCKIMSEKGFRGKWVESLELFLEQAKKKLIFRGVYRLFSVICILAAIVFGAAYFEAFVASEIWCNTASADAEIVNKARWTGIYNPVLAMADMVGYGIGQERNIEELESGEKDYRVKGHAELIATAISKNYYEEQAGLLAELITQNYPTAFYENKSECPVDITTVPEKRTSSRFTVTLFDKTAQIFLYDQEQDTTRQLLLDTVPTAYCFDEEENFLLLAAANRVYIYDLYGEAEPELLSYNFEDISRLVLQDNRIYALTEKTEHVIVWDNPLKERKIMDYKVSVGKLLQSKDGKIAAVYIKENSLILNVDNQEKVYPIPFEGSIDTIEIAVSPDGTHAAVAYRLENSDSDNIGIIDLSDGMLVKEYNTECDVAGFIYSDDGSSLIAACYDKNVIERINLADGSIQKSTGQTYGRPYAIIEYFNCFLVSDITGFLTVFNSDLNQIGDYRGIGYSAPAKQLAVSAKHDCLLTAGRGGNVLQGSYVTEIFVDDQTVFLPAEGVSVTSNTSLAVTDDGEYVAYGNSDGSIYLWDIGTMNQVWNVKGIPESVISMLFSKDASVLYVLGSSGTIYPVEIGEVMSEMIPGDRSSVWHMQVNRASEIVQKMYDLRLAL